MNQGFITLNRKILEWEWYKDANTFRVFLHLLLNANFKDTKYMGQIVPKGSLIIKQTEIAEELNLTRRQIMTVLNKLKKSETIEITTFNKFTLIKIKKYNDYQTYKECTTNVQQEDNKCTTDVQQMYSLDKQINNDNNVNNENNNTTTTNNNILNNNGWCCYPQSYVQAYLQSINPVASSLEIQKLISWEDELSPELINRAVQEAILANARNFKYINGILNRCIEQGITTVKQFDDMQKIRERGKQNDTRASKQATRDAEANEREKAFEELIGHTGFRC